MKKLDKFINIYNSYCGTSEKDFKEFWENDIDKKSPNLRKLILDEEAKICYFNIPGYYILGTSYLFDKPLSKELALKSSNIWFGIHLIDSLVDENLLDDNPLDFINNCKKALIGKSLEGKNKGLTKEVLTLLSSLGNKYDNSSIEKSLCDLGDASFDQINSINFEDYLKNNIGVGKTTGKLTYDIFNEFGNGNKEIENFFEKTTIAAGLYDSLRDFEEDQKFLKQKFSFYNKLTLVKEFSKYTSSLLKYHAFDVFNFFKVPMLAYYNKPLKK